MAGALAALQAAAPTAAELDRQAAAESRLRVVCTGLGKLALVGSVASGLALSGADLDFELHTPQQLCATEQAEHLHRISAALAEQGMKQVEVIITRSKAPSLVRFVYSGIHVDVSLRHGSDAKSVGVAKTELLRQYCTTSTEHTLLLLIKLWAKRRGMVDPTHGRLNSFSWMLMGIFYLQQSQPEVLQASHEASNPQELEILALLSGFFRFWIAWDMTKVASVRLSAQLDREDTQLNQAQARVLSNDGRCYLPTSQLSLMLEDPLEPDENVARTLADPLEWNAELMRASSVLEGGGAWSELCASPANRRYLELQQWVLQGPFVTPELAGQIEALLSSDGPRELQLAPMDGPGDA